MRDLGSHVFTRVHTEHGARGPHTYLPKAPYVLTIRRELKEVFMTCVGLSRLRTTGTLSQATRMPRATCTARRTMQPGGSRAGDGRVSFPLGLAPPPGRSSCGLTGVEGGSCPQPPHQDTL